MVLVNRLLLQIVAAVGSSTRRLGGHLVTHDRGQRVEVLSHATILAS